MSIVAGDTRTCRKCGRPCPADSDFCECGEYLRWVEDPAAQSAGLQRGPPTAQPGAAAGEPSATLTVRLAGAAASDADVALHATVLPGAQVELRARVSNVGRLVDEFTIAVEELPADWIVGDDRTVDLLPFGTQRIFVGERQIVIRPPRSPTSRAGTWPFAIALSSKSPSRRVVARVRGTLEVLPFNNVVATARPQIATGVRTGRFWCLVTNSGNTPVHPALDVYDGQMRLTITHPVAIVESGPLLVAPGETRSFPIQAKAPLMIIGQPVDHHVTILAKIASLEPPTPPVLVLFRQRPLIRGWVIAALLAVIAVALALYLAWPKKVTMPSVIGSRSSFVAQRTLNEAGLKGSPVVTTRVSASYRSPPGIVLAQTPRSGSRVPADTVATLVVAVPPAYAIVPDLRGLTIGRADSRLTTARLKLGAVVPTRASNRPIVSQVPLAGRTSPRGTAIDVVLAAPGKMSVPDVRCLRPKQAERALTKRGFVLGPLPPVLDPAAKVLSQLPAKGSRRPPGNAVTLIFKGDPCAKPKAGSVSRPESDKHQPETGNTPPSTPPGNKSVPNPTTAAKELAASASIAYDDGTIVHLAHRRAALATGRAPAWSRDGRLAYVAGLVVIIRRVGVSLAKAELAKITRDGVLPELIAFAPIELEPPVLAYTAAPASGPSLICFAAAAPGPAAPSCRTLPVKARALTWSPDGTTIFVAGTPPGSSRSALLSLHSSAAATTDATSWVDGPLIVPQAHGTAASVLDVALRPGGAMLGLVLDVDKTGAKSKPQVVLAPLDGLATLRGAEWPNASACQLAWSADGKRLAVIEPPAGNDRCPAADATGHLVSFPLTDPATHVLVAKDAHRPAWRPGR